MIRLTARNVVKRYAATVALDGVEFDIHAGAVNVLIGENGAGKSTLMRIVAGVERPDSGELILEGEPVSFRSVEDAAAKGIGIVHQELSLCPNLTVAENIFLVHGVTAGLTNNRVEERRLAMQALQRLGAEIDPDAIVGELSVGEQQLVEIARVLSRNASVLVLDEPTSALSASEIVNLFRVIDELRAADVAIVYISHRMQEIEQIGDYVTVLRNGHVVAAAARDEFSIPWIVRHMLGDEGQFPQRGPSQAGPCLLEVDGLEVRRANGNVAVDNVSLEIRSGELTAIYGLLGAGRTELFEALCGARPSRGTILLDGTEVQSLPLHQRIRAGLQIVPEDRKAAGIFANLAVSDNLSLSVLDRLRRQGFLSARSERSAVDAIMARIGVKAPSPAAPIGALSGGNQQKVLIGRSLMPEPRVLLLDEPGRGVDVGARSEIFESMRSLTRTGVAVLFSTSDLADALHVADRILVMSGGRITADVRAQDADEETLVRAASATIPHAVPVEAA